MSQEKPKGILGGTLGVTWGVSWALEVSWGVPRDVGYPGGVSCGASSGGILRVSWGISWGGVPGRYPGGVLGGTRNRGRKDGRKGGSDASNRRHGNCAATKNCHLGGALLGEPVCIMRRSCEIAMYTIPIPCGTWPRRTPSNNMTPKPRSKCTLGLAYIDVYRSILDGENV